jgi:hypothetical protein
MKLSLCIACMLWASSVAAGSPAAAQGRPSVLFCSPQGPAYGWVDLNYLAQLHQCGFEVDYTDSLADITPQRISHYNTLVIFVTPDAYDVTMLGQKTSPEKAQAFADMIDAYVVAGGGVLLMPTETNVLKQSVIDLTRRWGARLPVERIEEADKDKLSQLTHSSQTTPLAWTDQVLPSPVSNGVKQIWYPCAPAYNAQMTGPIVVDENWQVFVRASATARAKAVDLAKSTMPVLEDPFVRPDGESQPAFAALREYRGGRIALINQWRQFSIGSGTRYIFDSQVLSKGCGDRPSDFGRLLENTYRWLAETSLRAGQPGGYVAAPDRLQPPNQNPQVKRDYAERTWSYDPTQLGAAAPAPHLKLLRGLIGAKTTYSGGTSTVADYAQAAANVGLDFVVFLDDFAALTPEKLQLLREDCDRNSSDTLKLLPGFCIVNNIGNRMFFFSPAPAWIPDYCLTGPDHKTLYVQEEDAKGNYTGYLTPFLDWVLTSYHVEKGQVGYYNFSASPHGMRLWDLRLYGMAAVRYYRNGQLVEDVTEDYLTTAQATIPPAPVSVNEVASADELEREVKSGHALVYAQASSLHDLFPQALRWTHQYDAPNVFTSDGPIVHCWPDCFRVWTLGAEEFVTGSAVMPSPLSVSSERGLKEIRLYNGQQLFRRFLPGGAKEFQQTLVLDGTVQKNIVLVAEDMAGGKAVTFARRCWKDGSLAVSFCSDHVNDGTMALAHGPYSYPAIRHPALPTDIAGDTWDGGPLAALSLTGYQNIVPILESDQGREDGARFDQIPLLEFTDEGAMAVRSQRRELFDPRVLAVVNPWHTYGPITGPAPLMHYAQKYCEYLPPTIGVPQTGWAGPGVRQGTNASLLRNELIFQRDVTITSLLFGYFTGSPQAKVVISQAGVVREIDLATPGNYESFVMERGDWFGYYSPSLANSNVFFNRGEPFRIENRAPHLFFFAQRQGSAVHRDDRAVFELAAIGIPLNVEVKTPAKLVEYVRYLQQPAGLQVLRGQRVESPGLLELRVDDSGAVELVVPQPSNSLSLTLPCLISGLNPRWSAGLLQQQGYVKGDYGDGNHRYRALGLDLEGNAYVPLYVELAPQTHIVAGHPVTAGPEGTELFIQVTKVGHDPDRWHVSVNNPTDRVITTTLRPAMELPALTFSSQSVTLQPGEYRVLDGKTP